MGDSRGGREGRYFLNFYNFYKILIVKKKCKKRDCVGWGEINTLGGRQFTPSVGGNPHSRWGEIHALGGRKSTPSVGGNPHPWWGEIHTLGGGQSKLNYKKKNFVDLLTPCPAT